MPLFILKRFSLGVLVLLGVVIITFILARVVPSDPASQWAGPRATTEQVMAAQVELGLDKPIYIQFEKYMSSLIQGDLGYSLETHQPVSKELKTYLPATIELVLTSTLFAVAIGLVLGVFSASRKNQWPDHIIRFFTVGFVALPTFWFGLLLQVIFYRILGILPMGGQLSMDTQLFYTIPNITGFMIFDSLITGNIHVFIDLLIHMILPCITIAAYPIGLVARMTRSALLEILNEDYIKAARSYGLTESKIMWSYALKNSLGPTITVITLSVGYTLVNTFLVETIFSWPGIGSYVANAVVTLNYPSILGVTIFSACAYIFLNIFADIIIALDPRVRI